MSRWYLLPSDSAPDGHRASCLSYVQSRGPVQKRPPILSKDIDSPPSSLFRIQWADKKICRCTFRLYEPSLKCWKRLGRKINPDRSSRWPNPSGLTKFSIMQQQEDEKKENGVVPGSLSSGLLIDSWYWQKDSRNLYCCPPKDCKVSGALNWISKVAMVNCRLWPKLGSLKRAWTWLMAAKTVSTNSWWLLNTWEKMVEAEGSTNKANSIVRLPKLSAGLLLRIKWEQKFLKVFWWYHHLIS